MSWSGPKQRARSRDNLGVAKATAKAKANAQRKVNSKLGHK